MNQSITATPDTGEFLFSEFEVINKQFDIEKYREIIESGSEIDDFNQNPCLETATALTFKIYDAANEAAPEGSGTIISSSTGKDSSMCTNMWWRNALMRKALGKRLLPAVIAIADTAAEFPAMTKRMYDSKKFINEQAKIDGLDLKCVINRPPIKDRLYVNLFGNGLALPQLRDRGDALAGSNWCVRTLKSQPIKKISEMASNTFDFHIQVAGVRMDESVKRQLTIKRRSDGLPFGLTTFGDGSSLTIGLTPIVHHTTAMLREWSESADLMNWNPLDMEELRAIYEQGSPIKGEGEIGECSLVSTADGFGAVCKDLSVGTRYGCMTCLKSKNLTLKNTAIRDPRYKWIYQLHKAIYRQHREGDRLRKYKNMTDGVLNQINCFPKGFTFERRATLLMLLFRAELSAKLTLLIPEEEEAINNAWKRSGIFNITTSIVRESARQWAITGKAKRLWHTDSKNYQELDRVLASGFPLAAFYNHLNPDLPTTHRINSNFKPLLGQEAFVSPELKTYVFHDKSRPEIIIHAISDHSGFLGNSSNNSTFHGLVPSNWTLQAVRACTPWETALSCGRIVMYWLDRNEMTKNINNDNSIWDFLEENKKTRKLSKREIMITKFHRPLEKAWMATCTKLIEGGRRTDNLYADMYQKKLDGADHDLTDIELADLEATCQKMLNLSSRLNKMAINFGKGIDQRRITSWQQMPGKSGEKSRAAQRRFARDYDYSKAWNLAQEYISGMQNIVSLLQNNRITTQTIVQIVEGQFSDSAEDQQVAADWAMIEEMERVS